MTIRETGDIINYDDQKGKKTFREETKVILVIQPEDNEESDVPEKKDNYNVFLRKKKKKKNKKSEVFEKDMS